jgi:sulfofructose kinase
VVSILAIGYNAFDVICPLQDLPPPDSKRELAEIWHGGGGPAATAAVALAKLGAAVRLVTPLADDLPGHWQKHELMTAGVDISLCPSAVGARTPQAVILVDSEREQRTILWSRGDLPHLDAGNVRNSWLDDADLLFADSHEPQAARVLAEAARARGLPVVLDAGTARAGIEGLVRLCTDVISSSVFAPALTGRRDPGAALRALRDLGPARVAMTFGEAGCVALVGGRLQHVPAFAVPVKDTTGAGDAFHAGYAFARARGDPWTDCLVFGSAVAALKCRDWGGRRGLPTLAEVERLLRSGRRRCETPPCG